jgi:hypothetical protein
MLDYVISGVKHDIDGVLRNGRSIYGQMSAAWSLGLGDSENGFFAHLHKSGTRTLFNHTKRAKGVTLMVWGAFGAGQRSELVFMPGDPESKRGGVTSAVYLEVLEDQLPTLWEPGLEFMQDNARIHTAKIIKEWFKEQGIVVVEWPGMFT